MNVLEEVICATFPDCDRAKLNLTLKLGDIEGWDSMSAVSFSLDLENAFHVKLGNSYFRSDQTIGDVHVFLKSQGVSV